MDPDSTLAIILDRDHDPTAREAAYFDLAYWLGGGGFEPDHDPLHHPRSAVVLGCIYARVGSREALTAIDALPTT